MAVAGASDNGGPVKLVLSNVLIFDGRGARVSVDDANEAYNVDRVQLRSKHDEDDMATRDGQGTDDIYALFKQHNYVTRNRGS